MTFRRPGSVGTMEIEHMEEWIDSQIVKIDEKKWGSKVSAKLFVDREYVVKHIRNKHPALLEAERSQVCASAALTS